MRVKKCVQCGKRFRSMHGRMFYCSKRCRTKMVRRSHAKL